MHIRRKYTMALLAAFAITSALPAQARRTSSSRRASSNTEGLMLGAHLNATFINSPGNSSLPLGYGDDDGWVSGPGFGGIIGWGFNQNVMLYAGLDGAMLDFRNLADDDPLPPAN